MTKFHVLTLFPDMVQEGLRASILGRAQEKHLIQINTVNIRNYTLDKHGKTDDYTYGGGAGMLMQAQPVYDAWKSVSGGQRLRTIYVTPQGRVFQQKLAQELAQEEEIIFLCGHYEGIDERVLEEIVTDRVSIGDYVLTGGELPVMVMIDAVSRLLPGVLSNEESAHTESFYNDLLEYPQYSRPEVWHGKAVPAVLLSGNHKEIEKWRLEASLEKTRAVRPELYEKYQERQKAVELLLKHKKENIYLIDGLRRGTVELRGILEQAVLGYHRETDLWMLCAENAACGEKLLNMETVRGKVRNLLHNCGELNDTLQQAFGLELRAEYQQAVYTPNQTVSVRHKDIRLLDRNCFSGECLGLPDKEQILEQPGGSKQEKLADIDGREKTESAAEVLAKQRNAGETQGGFAGEKLDERAVYGIFAGEKRVGSAGFLRRGGLGGLYVEESFRRLGYGSSLTAFLVNRALEQGAIPYLHFLAQNDAARKMSEKIGFYRANRPVYFMGEAAVDAKLREFPLC